MKIKTLIKIGMVGQFVVSGLLLCSDQKTDAQAKTLQEEQSRQILDEIRSKLNNQMPSGQKTMVMSGLTAAGTLRHFTLKLLAEDALSHYSYNIETKELRQEQKG